MPRNRRSETEQANFKQRNETIEVGQPDPELQEGVAGPGRIAVYAIAALVILGVMLYGLNRPWPETVAARQGASGGSAPATTGAAPQDSKPQSQAPGDAQPATGKTQ